jgi:hypothetical protein
MAATEDFLPTELATATGVGASLLSGILRGVITGIGAKTWRLPSSIQDRMKRKISIGNIYNKEELLWE